MRVALPACRVRGLQAQEAMGWLPDFRLPCEAADVNSLTTSLVVQVR